MRKMILLVLLILAFAAPGPVAAQRGWDRPGLRRLPVVEVPNLSGTWYMHGDPNLPTEIVQRRLDGRALFINEHGDEAGAEIQGDRVWIPEWNDGPRRGLVGYIRGNKIVWPNGTYWSRSPGR